MSIKTPVWGQNFINHDPSPGPGHHLIIHQVIAFIRGNWFPIPLSWICLRNREKYIFTRRKFTHRVNDHLKHNQVVDLVGLNESGVDRAGSTLPFHGPSPKKKRRKKQRLLFY